MIVIARRIGVARDNRQFSRRFDLVIPQRVSRASKAKMTIVAAETGRSAAEMRRQSTSGSRIPEPEHPLPTVAREQIAAMIEADYEAVIVEPFENERFRPGIIDSINIDSTIMASCGSTRDATKTRIGLDLLE